MSAVLIESGLDTATRRVIRGCVRLMGQLYALPQLQYGWEGHEVEVRYQMGDASHVLLFTLDGEFMGRANRVQPPPAEVTVLRAVEDCGVLQAAALAEPAEEAGAWRPNLSLIDCLSVATRAVRMLDEHQVSVLSIWLALDRVTLRIARPAPAALNARPLPNATVEGESFQQARYAGCILEWRAN